MCIHRHMLMMLIGLGANSDGSIYLGTRKICFHWYLQEQMSNEWVRDVGSASVSNHWCAGWLRKYAERDATASMAWYSFIVLHIQGKKPPADILDLVPFSQAEAVQSACFRHLHNHKHCNDTGSKAEASKEDDMTHFTWSVSVFYYCTLTHYWPPTSHTQIHSALTLSLANELILF